MFKKDNPVSAADLMDLVRKLNSTHVHQIADTYQGIGTDSSPLQTENVNTSPVQIGSAVNVRQGSNLSSSQIKSLADSLQYLLVHKHTHQDKCATACNCNCNCNCTRGSF